MLSKKEASEIQRWRSQGNTGCEKITDFEMVDIIYRCKEPYDYEIDGKRWCHHHAVEHQQELKQKAEKYTKEFEFFKKERTKQCK